jgi:L-alanine-DL-glutamate epimerase-like enolase superfamily enzyme
MRIVSAEVFAVANPTPYIGGPVWLFVRLDSDSGISGYGEMFTAQTYVRPTTLATIVEEFIEDFILGEDPTATERLFHKYYNSHYSHVGEMLKSAIFSSVEMACWDIHGKSVGRAVYDLLGGRFRDRVRTYTYVNAPAGQADKGFDFWLDSDAVADRAGELIAEGFTALKLDPFPMLIGSATHLGQAIPVQWTLEALDVAERTVALVRERAGSKCDIIIGTHGQMTAAGAIRFAKRIERFDPLWFEEPVPPDLPSEMSAVARATSIPITAGERLTSKWEFARLFRERAVSIINPDVSQVGGLLEAKKIAALAEASGVQFSPHVYGGPFACIAALHLGLTVPNFLVCEGMGRYEGLHAELLDESIEWRDGYAYLSDRPGLGYTLNESRARELRANESVRLWGGLDGTRARVAHGGSEPSAGVN